jgi:hypothetical protein
MNQTCSDCALGLRQIELSSPFGYNAKGAAQFASSTSACNASGYGLTPPTPYALTPTSTASGTATTRATPTCISTYTLRPGDSCSSVSKANNVSTYSLLASNGLRTDCTNFPAANGTLCIPPKCATYTVKSYDTCRSILDHHDGISSAQFISWNPNINSLCGNLYLSVGKEICVRSVYNNLNCRSKRSADLMKSTRWNCSRSLRERDSCSSSVQHSFCSSKANFGRFELDHKMRSLV